MTSAALASFPLQFLGTTDDERFVNGVSCALCLAMFGGFLHLCRGTAAPYGRYSGTRSYGFLVNGKVAWIVQEFPSLAVPLYLYGVGPTDTTSQTANQILLGMFLFHYFNRTVIFPLRIRGGKPTPFFIMLSAIFFTTVNGYIQGKHLTAIKAYGDEHLTSPSFVLGSLLFWTGVAINWHSDAVLRNLRKPGETGYKIPRGGMFEYVSGANFFGEILEWAGFALACGGSLPAVTFALNTAFNIGPRAVQHHQWYLEKFDDYQKLGRYAIVPFLV